MVCGFEQMNVGRRETMHCRARIGQWLPGPFLFYMNTDPEQAFHLHQIEDPVSSSTETPYRMSANWRILDPRSMISRFFLT